MTRSAYNSSGLPSAPVAREALQQFVVGVEDNPFMDYAEYQELSDSLASPLSLALSGLIFEKGHAVQSPVNANFPEYWQIDTRRRGWRFKAISQRPADQDYGYAADLTQSDYRRITGGFKASQILLAHEYDDPASATAIEKSRIYDFTINADVYKAGDAKPKSYHMTEEDLDLRFQTWHGDYSQPEPGPTLRQHLAMVEAGGPEALRNYLRVSKPLVSELLAITED